MVRIENKKQLNKVLKAVEKYYEANKNQKMTVKQLLEKSKDIAEMEVQENEY